MSGDWGLGTRDSGLGTRDSGLGTRDSGNRKAWSLVVSVKTALLFVFPALVAACRVFSDEPAQATQRGACQHAVAAGLLATDDIAPIGAVINGDRAGRSGGN